MLQLSFDVFSLSDASLSLAHLLLPLPRFLQEEALVGFFAEGPGGDVDVAV